MAAVGRMLYSIQPSGRLKHDDLLEGAILSLVSKSLGLRLTDALGCFIDGGVYEQS